MPSLFAYGTLRDEAMQRAVFGRRLSGRADELHGFERATLTIEEEANAATGERASATYPILRYDGNAGSRIAGTVFEVDDAELERADRYEGAAYRRIEVRLASGVMAWVYVDPHALPPPLIP